MAKHFIEEISHEQKTSKAGKNYTTCGLKIDGQWRNGFGNATTKTWEQGMSVDVELFEEEYNGKMYKKFKIATATDNLEKRIAALEDTVQMLVANTKN